MKTRKCAKGRTRKIAKKNKGKIEDVKLKFRALSRLFRAFSRLQKNVQSLLLVCERVALIKKLLKKL
jgi:hypothetical protein